MLLLALPLLMSSCLSESKSTPDPMAPGIAIYSAASMRSQLAMTPANAAMRLAILLAEAEAAGEENPLEYMVDKQKLKDILFSPNDKIEAVPTSEGMKYTITFPYDIQFDYFFGYYTGKIVIETNGMNLTELGADWTVSTEGLQVHVNTGYSTTIFTYNESSHTELSNQLGNTVNISLENFVLSDSNANRMLDNWGGNYTVMGELKYAAGDVTQTYSVNGTAGDRILSWKLSNVHYKGVTINAPKQVTTQILDGTFTAAFDIASGYDPEVYPSPEVKVSFSNNGQNYTVTYNGTSQAY